MAYKPEDIDLDSFLNLDGHFASPNLTSLKQEKGLIVPQFQQPPIEKINTYAPFQTSQIFSGPSHQYDQHKQHIPLPPGALANSLAAARKTNFQFNNNFAQYGMGSDNALFDMGDEFMDFGAINSHRPSYASTTDMDMDFDSPIDGLYTSDFVDPSAIGGNEEDSPVPARAEIVRVYPGMHSHQAQQAALAKQQQQLEIQRQQQQQIKARQVPQQPAQKPTAPKGVNKAPADPVVEERISRLLNQMRQDVKSPSSQGEEQSPSASMIRSKKEEEEMDEDERLLASEEGKKLSSKERRQLRNKVSARAFRSRRKEYIGQLEGEVAQKKSEADTLRAENEALKAENTRLTDLTKLLLSSSAFSEFLNDLSTNGLPPSIMSAPTQSSAETTTPQPEPQQSQSQSLSQQPTPQPMMSTLVEDIDFEALEADTNWNSGMDFSFAPQVYAVTEIPEGPILDVALLSGKSSCLPAFSSEEKETVPVIEVAPVLQKEEPKYTIDSSVSYDKADPAFALFSEETPCPSTPAYELFGSISFEKATETYNLVDVNTTPSADGVVSAATMARFERLCSTLDSLSLRLDSLILN